MIDFSKEACVLLDVGEGTLGQILRFYGQEADDVIRKLKAIYISHLHADHHIGMVIIYMKNEIYELLNYLKKLILVYPFLQVCLE